jgi:hypothetical protein
MFLGGFWPQSLQAEGVFDPFSILVSKRVPIMPIYLSLFVGSMYRDSLILV